MREPLDQRTLATIKIYDGKTKTWSESVRSIAKESSCRHDKLTIPLSLGGTIQIFPNLIQHETSMLIKHELLMSGLFRQYRIQNNDEPRCHFLLHQDATDRDDDPSFPEPGYRYASVTMKSRPLSRLPQLESLSREMLAHANADKWNIGVNPVLYRCGRDKIGGHADDDQGETIIMTAIVDSPQQVRPVVVRPAKRNKIPQHGDEMIQLFLGAGDAYSMDGTMQLFYTHQLAPVPVKDRSCETSNSRLIVVFRAGEQLGVSTDSGRPCNIQPRQIRLYQNGTMDSLKEGHLYSRTQLYEMGAHLMQQRGISGNMTSGCDAIIVSGLRSDKLGSDTLTELVYAAESSKGGRSICKSHVNTLPIRVFRSSVYQNQFKATDNGVGSNQPTMYRYDGLYEVVKVYEPLEEKGPFRFVLKRDDGIRNEFSNDQILVHCERLSTVPTESQRKFLRWWGKDLRLRLRTIVEQDSTALYYAMGLIRKKEIFQHETSYKIVTAFLLKGFSKARKMELDSSGTKPKEAKLMPEASLKRNAEKEHGVTGPVRSASRQKSE